MSRRTVIGLDVGRSAVKVVASVNGVFHRLTFPALFADDMVMSDEDAEHRAAVDRVEIDGRTYLTGDSVRLQIGQAGMVGLADNWTDGVPYRALVASALKRLKLQAAIVDNPLVVVGTPAANHLATRDALKAITAATLGAEVLVTMQPMGAYFAHVFSPSGVPLKDQLIQGNRRRSWAVVEVGHYTTDFLLMRENTVVEAGHGSCEGAVEAAKALQQLLQQEGIQADTLGAEEALRSRTIFHFGARDVGAQVDKAVAALVQKITSKGDALLSRHVANVDGVLLAGGGASIVYEAIKRKWPHAVQLPSPREAVAEGYCRWGVGRVLRAEATTAEKAHG